MFTLIVGTDLLEQQYRPRSDAEEYYLPLVRLVRQNSVDQDQMSPEPLREKTYHWTGAPNKDSNQPLCLQSDCLHCLHEATLHSWLSKMHPLKSLIRL